MIETLDPLEGIDCDGATVLRNRVDYPELSILAGDRLIVRPADTADAGEIVVATVDGLATVRRFEAGVTVMGLVVGVVRRV